MNGAAQNVLSTLLPIDSIEKIFILFPDPWPKKRHAKHRIINPDFVQELQRVLKQEGVVTTVTDDPDYSEIMKETLFANKNLSPIHPDPYFASHIEGYGTSFFDSLWRGKGKNIFYHQYKKVVEKH